MRPDPAGRHLVTPVLRQYQQRDRAALVSLWARCGLTRPWNDPYRDIDRKLRRDAPNLLVLEDGGQLVGSVMVGYEGHRGWVNYLAVHPGHQRRGLGRLLMDEAERRLRELGCAKVSLQIRTSNEAAVEFYRRIGYTFDDVISMGRRLEEDGVRPDPAGGRS
jgi:ribosomal protein S18 acetylase RimI-like enzyme